jgi:dolichol-phosphate mannosyltransferase
MNPKTLIIIPTYNERENIERMLTAVHAAVPDAEVLVVDDGSPDGTGDLVEARGLVDGRIHLLRRSGKLGLGTAYLAGFAFALERDYQRVIEMDADFSHDPKYLQPMIDASANADMVIGSRYVEGGGTVDWGLSRRLISRGGGL